MTIIHPEDQELMKCKVIPLKLVLRNIALCSYDLLASPIMKISSTLNANTKEDMNIIFIRFLFHSLSIVLKMLDTSYFIFMEILRVDMKGIHN